MRFIANLMDFEVDPGPWATAREAEGWDGVAASDHYFVRRGSRWYPHLWVAVAQMAAATDRIVVTSAFANNLFRSPVEFVLASLTMQRASAGRWEAGLGAGWNKEELELTGQPFPSNRERADRYSEAVQVARRLFDDRACAFDGEYYHVHVDDMAGFDDVASPPLVGAVGGPRTVRRAVPFLDRVDLKVSSVANRSGSMDYQALGRLTRQDLAALVARVREVSEDVPLGFFALCGEEASGAQIRTGGEDSLYGRLFGDAGKIADTLLGLEADGITYVNVCPKDESTFERLAPYLFGR